MIHRAKRILSLLCILCLCSSVAASVSDTETRAVQYFDGSYAEVTGTEERAKDWTEMVMGSKQFTYYDPQGNVLFSYIIKTRYVYDGTKAEDTGHFTMFYVSEGWEKQEDSFDGKHAKAVFSNGETEKTVRLTLSCSKNGKIS